MLIVMPLWLYLLVLPAILMWRFAAWSTHLALRACVRLANRRRSQ